ncbi:MAG: hypothetical protein P8177_04900 [Gemmatimonadota bacterium]
MEGPSRGREGVPGVRGQQGQHGPAEQLGHRLGVRTRPAEDGDGRLVRQPGPLQGGPERPATVFGQQLEVGKGIGAEHDKAGIRPQSPDQEVRVDADAGGEVAQREGDHGFCGQDDGGAVDGCERHGGLRLSDPPS